MTLRDSDRRANIQDLKLRGLEFSTAGNDSSNTTGTTLYNVLPPGGTTGQVLDKIDGNDYNVQWATVSGGGSSPTSVQGVAVILPSGEDGEGEPFMVPPGSVIPAASGANPTATAGPVAINGSASSFLRSDGAPAVQLGTVSQKGLLQPDGTTITVASGIISAAIGSGLNIDRYGPPLSANFTTFTGDATSPVLSDVTNLGMVVDSGVVTGSAVLRGAKQLLPAATYTFSTRLRRSASPRNYRATGIAITDGTKFLAFSFYPSLPQLSVQSWNTSASLNSTVTSTVYIYQYVRIKNDGTHRTYWVSDDGINWSLWYQEATGTFLTETSLCVITQPYESDTTVTTDHVYTVVPWMTATTP